MKIEKFQAKNVRSFKEELNIELSDFNVFVGENSTGKSNLITLILTALQSIGGSGVNIPPYDGRFPEQSNFSCLIKFDQGDIKEIASTEEFNRLVSESKNPQVQGIENFRRDIELFSKQPALQFVSSWSKEKGAMVSQSFPQLPGIQTFSHSGPIDMGTQNRLNFTSRFFGLVRTQILRKFITVPDTRDLAVYFSMTPANGNSPINANSILTYVAGWMMNDRNIYDEFKKLVTEILPRLADLQVYPAQQMANLFVKEETLEHPLPGSELSKGSREIFVLLGAIALARESSLIFIEEPEIHLHPAAIKKLKTILLDTVKKKRIQVVISTHHPLFLQDLYPEADKTVKFFKFENQDRSGNHVSEIRTDAEISELIDKLTMNIGH